MSEDHESIDWQEPPDMAVMLETSREITELFDDLIKAEARRRYPDVPEDELVIDYQEWSVDVERLVTKAIDDVLKLQRQGLLSFFKKR